MYVVRSVSVGVLMLLVQPVAAAEPESLIEVADIFAKMRAHLARIISIEYTSGMTWKRTFKGEAAESDHEYAFAYAEGKYRWKLRLKPARGAAQSSRDYAYDGTRYQEFYGDTDYLVRSSKPLDRGYGGSQLFLCPYALIIRPSSRTMADYLDKTVWQKVAAGAVLEGSKPVDGHPCLVVRIAFSGLGREDIRRVHVATDLEYLPILIESQSQGARMDQFSFRLSNLQSFQTPAGRVVIALNGVGKGSFSGNPDVQQWWINADSLKVNQPIPAERFTIPPALAKRVHDVD